MSDSGKKPVTRAAVRLLVKEGPSPPEFKPRHRSTEVISGANEESDNEEVDNTASRTVEQNLAKSKEIRDFAEQRETASGGTESTELVDSKHGKEADEPEGQKQQQILQRPPNQRAAPERNNPIPTPAMDVTISESLANPKTPAVPKFLCPPTFDPCSGNAVSFMKNYERTAAANSWDNNLKITYLGTFLEGAADLWFSRYKLNQENQRKTWANIKEDYLKEFGGSDVKRMLEKKLYGTKQRPGQSIRAYYYELQAIFADYDPTFDIEEFRKFFENGMDKDLYRSYRLVLEEDLDWDKFKKIVKKLEDISASPDIGIPMQSLKISDDSKCHHCHHNCGQGNQDAQIEKQERERGHQYSQDGNYRGHRTRGNWSRSNAQQRFGPGPRNRRYQEGQHLQAGRNNSYHQRYPPNTRSSDGRPRCFLCNKVGHFVVSCPENRRQHPNTDGRRK